MKQHRHAHRARNFAAVRFVSRMLGREPKPHLDGVKSSMHPTTDRDLPYWVSTDHDVWATTESAEDAVAFATRLAPTLPEGERVFVTFVGIVIWTGRGGEG